MDLTNKVAIITGAGGGMGKEVILQFLEKGARVTAVDINLDSIADLPEKYPDHLMIIKANLTDEDSVAEIVQKTVDLYQQVDVLVNVAGIAQSATDIENVTLKEWERIMTINSTAIFLTCRAVVPFMKKQNNGVIINVASISVERPRPGLNAYIASKGAAVALTKALAIELAPHNIRVNGINPGPADTNMLGEFAAAGSDVGDTKENTFLKSIPLGKLVTPEDIAHCAVYLSSDLAGMITGSIVNVDGGRGI
jgi:3-oxoacyl-[acyl-carrier protein] reductase